MNYNIYEELSKLNEFIDSDNFSYILSEALNTGAEAIGQDVCESLKADYEEISSKIGFDFNPDYILAGLRAGDIAERLENVIKEFLK